MPLSSLLYARSERDMYETELARAEAYENASVEPDEVDLDGMTRGQLLARCRDLAELAEDMYATIADFSEVCADGFFDRLAELGLEVEL